MSETFPYSFKGTAIAACFVFALCLTVSGKVAQTRAAMPGKLTGRIVDHVGLYIPGATITITRRGFRRQFWSGADGTYFKQLPPGTYDVLIYHYGFLPFRKRIHIEPGVGLNLDVALHLNPKLTTKTIIITKRGIDHGKRNAVCRCEIFMMGDKEETLCAVAQGTVSLLEQKESRAN